MLLKALFPGPMPSQGRSCTIATADIQTLMRKLLELSPRPASRLATRVRMGSICVTATAIAAVATTTSARGTRRRQIGGQSRMLRSTTRSPTTPSDASMPSQPPRL